MSTFSSFFLQLLFITFSDIRHPTKQIVVAASSLRTPTEAIADQLGFGVKRVVHYLNLLLESCDNVEDLNDWIFFMNSYLNCDAKAEPKKLMKQRVDSTKRLSELCAAWPTKRKCSSSLAVKLDSCLGSRLEDGRSGTNALRLADSHMNFICHHHVEYAENLWAFDGFGEILPLEQRSLTCYRESQESLKECIRGEELSRPQTTFCQKFGLAKECLLKTWQDQCGEEGSRDFLRTMLGQMEFDLKCFPPALEN